MRELKDHLQRAQNQQNLYVDKKRVESSFEAGDLVYLRLQPYRHTSYMRNGVEKIKGKFHGLG
jgi:hypothetical protein